MVVLKIIGIILAVLALLIAVLLLLPVDLLLKSDEEKGFSFGVRVLGMVFTGGKKEKKKEKKKKPDNPLVKAVKKLLGVSNLENAQAIRGAVEEQGASEALQDTVQSVFLLLDRVLWLIKHCRIPYCRIVSVSGGENAALDYGIACAAIYPLVGYLQEKLRLKQRDLTVDIRCDYGLDAGKFLLDLAIRIRVVHVLRALLHIIKKNVEKELTERV